VHVNFMLFVLVLLFTFSRAECPCPKNFTGKGSWDPKKHWMVRDFKIVVCKGKPVLAVRFKAIKQDPRIERPTAGSDGREEERGEKYDKHARLKGGNDWSYIGSAPGSVLDPLEWFKLYIGFFEEERLPTAPFFLAADGVRPYTYRAANADLKGWLAVVSPDDGDFGFHGLRVEGYNQSVNANGEKLTVAHGLWQSTSHDRYGRFAFVDVCGIAAAMMGVANAYAAEDGERVVGRGGTVRATARADDGGADAGGEAGAADEEQEQDEQDEQEEGGEDGDDDDEGEEESEEAADDVGAGVGVGRTPVRRGGTGLSLATPPGWSSRSLDGGRAEYVPPSSFEGAGPVRSLAQARRMHNERARLAVDGPGLPQMASGPRPRRPPG